MKRGLATLAVFVIVAAGYTFARDTFNGSPTTTTEPPSTRCTEDQLTTTWVDGTGAAGTLYAWVKMTNTSGTACAVPAKPTIAFLDAAGGSLPSELISQSSDGQLLDWNDSPVTTKGAWLIMLESGTSAAMALSFVNDSSCSTVSLMRLRWDGGGSSVAPRYLVSQCNGPSGLHSRVYFAS